MAWSSRPKNGRRSVFAPGNFERGAVLFEHNSAGWGSLRLTNSFWPIPTEPFVRKDEGLGLDFAQGIWIPAQLAPQRQPRWLAQGAASKEIAKSKPCRLLARKRSPDCADEEVVCDIDEVGVTVKFHGADVQGCAVLRA